VADAATSVAGAVLAEVTRSILERVKRGEKLSTEELMILLLDLNYRQIIELRKEMLELYRQLNGRIDRLDKKMESMRSELDAKIEGVRRELNSKIEAVRREINQRLDAIYQLLLKMIEQRKE